MYALRPRRALIASALVAALVASSPGEPRAEEAEKPAEAGKTAEPGPQKPAKPKKTRKQLQEERLKYQISPDAGRVFQQARVELESRGERDLRGLERPVRLYAPPGEPGGVQRDAVEAVRSVYARVRGNRG